MKTWEIVLLVGAGVTCVGMVIAILVHHKQRPGQTNALTAPTAASLRTALSRPPPVSPTTAKLDQAQALLGEAQRAVGGQ